MRFNITTDDAEFFINEKKKTVTCVINNTSKLFYDFITDNSRVSPECDIMYNIQNDINHGHSILAQKLRMPNRFIGIATCGPDDEWDIEIGKAWAFSRAKDNILNSFYKRAQTYVDTLAEWVNDAADELDALGKKLEKNTLHRHMYIESLVNKENKN